MYQFNSPIIYDNIWQICLKTKKELNEIYNKDRKEAIEDDLGGIIEYSSSTIYLDKNLDDDSFRKSLRKQLMNLYLWETGQQDHLFTQEELCDLASVAASLICKTTENLILQIKQNLKGEKANVNI